MMGGGQLFIRDRTDLFVRRREAFHSNLRRTPAGAAEMFSVDDRHRLLSSDSEVSGGSLALELPPMWMAVIDEVKSSLENINSQMDVLRRLQKEQLKVTFDEKIAAESSQQIEILTQQITLEFNRCRDKVKSIGIVDEFASNSSIFFRKNIMHKLAQELQQASRQFRVDQNNFLKALRGQKELGGSLFEMDAPSDDEEVGMVVDRGLTKAQLETIDLSNRLISERERSIIALSNSINQLHELFKDMAVLVVDQGTMLDRIDYNIEQVVQNTEAALKDTEKANKYQKGIRNKLIFLFIIIIILAVTTIILAKLLPELLRFGMPYITSLLKMVALL